MTQKLSEASLDDISKPKSSRLVYVALIVVALFGISASYFTIISNRDQIAKQSTVQSAPSLASTSATSTAVKLKKLDYQPRIPMDGGGYALIQNLATGWPDTISLVDLGVVFKGLARKSISDIENRINNDKQIEPGEVLQGRFLLSTLYNNEGEPEHAAEQLQAARKLAESSDEMAQDILFSLIYLQGVTELRRGENANCILCRGESSCILPISKAAQHTNPEGSRKAIEYFTEYLEQFPMDLEAGWLLNVAHMTLGEYPEKVDPKYLIPLDRYAKSEFNIGKFRDIGHIVGLNQLTQAGGAIMEDFDNDGLLDIVITSFDATYQMQYFRNTGDGKFVERTKESGLIGQLGGLNCVQTDFNNDGNMDIFVVRGAWLSSPIRPSLLQNDGTGHFTDVTESAGLLAPVNSISSTWGDYDNDGWLDLFICCEKQPSLLYRNLGNSTFEEVSIKAGVISPSTFYCKGANWIDFDNDGFQDLFVNYLNRETPSKLFHNNRDGSFTNVAQAQGINGPVLGFSCWAWDYNNDGWMDIFATSYDRTLADVITSMLGKQHQCEPNRLYCNMQGKGFKDVTREAGLDMVFATMGSNFGDFDNDGFLEMYLGTGEPDLATLVPNRMFKNVAGKRFAEISASSGTGSLQKGHGVACGDWDRDGNTDVFIEMGGAINGDKYHNILFQNPGHDNNWLTVKLTGDKSNRAAIGARIKLVTKGQTPQTVYRHVSSGSSFGANPLQQTIGIGKAEGIAELEITWPTTGTTQIFRDLEVDQAISITEFADDYKKLDWKVIPHAEDTTPAKKMAAIK